MGRSPKPAKGKAKPAVSRKSPKNEGARVRDLKKRLAEALEQQTASAISSQCSVPTGLGFRTQTQPRAVLFCATVVLSWFARRAPDREARARAEGLLAACARRAVPHSDRQGCASRGVRGGRCAVPRLSSSPGVVVHLRAFG